MKEPKQTFLLFDELNIFSKKKKKKKKEKEDFQQYFFHNMSIFRF